MNLVWLSGIFGFVGVALGAMGAHALRGRVSVDMIEIWKTGVLYHLVHTLALLGVAALGERVTRQRLVGALFTTGIVIFSGSLYLLVLTNRGWFGAITPVGGVAFMAGWLVLAFSTRSSSG